MSSFIARGRTAILARSSAVAICVALGTPALADLTAQDAWGAFKSYMELTGYNVDGNETEANGKVTVTDAVLSMTLAGDMGSSTMKLNSLTFEELGNGTVRVTAPEEIPVEVGYEVEGESGTGKLVYMLGGADIIMSGDLSDYTIDLNASEVAMIMDMPLEPGSDGLVRMDLDLGDLISTSRIVMGDVPSYDQTASAKGATYTIDVTDPEEQTTAQIKGAVNDLSYAAKGGLPSDPMNGDLAKALSSGLTLDGWFKFASGNTEMTVSSPEGDMALAGTTGAGTVTLLMNEDRMGFSGERADGSLTVQGAGIPFPVSLTMESSAFNLAVPVGESDEAQPFDMLVKLGNFSVSDQLWGMIDPNGVMPRDPANLTLDLTGTAKLGLSIFDPASADLLEDGDDLGSLESLKIKELLVSAMGAQITGNGDFTFDNSGEEPMPIGTLNLFATGLNALGTNLAKLGVVSQEEVMGVLFLMSSFTTPGDTPDSVSTKIELKENGSIFANGTQVK
jgi:hypothetical protein